MNFVKKTRPVRPDDFELIEAVPGIIGIARDQNLKLFWSTPSFDRISPHGELGQDPAGTTLDDFLPESAAREREQIHREVMSTGQPASHYQFLADHRLICTVFPLDEAAFGHRGVLAVLVDAPVETVPGAAPDTPVLSSTSLNRLSVLSSRELEVLHYIARGMTTNSIAEKVSRSSKTIEKQVNSIHTKLGTHSRAELVRFASERGIQSFSTAEWMTIVEGARISRRETERAP